MESMEPIRSMTKKAKMEAMVVMHIPEAEVMVAMGVMEVAAPQDMGAMEGTVEMVKFRSMTICSCKSCDLSN
jgi:hypothetical protein